MHSCSVGTSSSPVRLPSFAGVSCGVSLVLETASGVFIVEVLFGVFVVEVLDLLILADVETVSLPDS